MKNKSILTRALCKIACLLAGQVINLSYGEAWGLGLGVWPGFDCIRKRETQTFAGCRAKEYYIIPSQ